MKKVFKSILVTVAAALAFASCQREGDVNGTEGRTVRFLAGPVETRTAFSTPDATGQYPVLWTENDTKVKVSLNMASGVDATVTPNGATAEFEASVNTENAEAPYTFYALSPSTAYFSISSKYMDWGLQIPSDQVPSAGTPDEAAQVLAGVSAACTSLDEVITVNFSHVTAYGRMTLTGLDLAGAAVTGVSLTAAQPISGRFYYYVADTEEHEAGELVALSASNTLNLETASLEDIWFACAPADLSGTELKVTVYTADGPYEKTITLPANRKFQAGRIAKFTVDMTGAVHKESQVYELVTDPAELTPDSQVIIANAAGDYAIGTTQNSNNRAAAAVAVVDDAITDPSESVQILTIEAETGGTVAFKAGTAGYLAATGSNSYQLTTVAETGANTNFTVSISDGEANVNAAGVSRGQMRFNPNNGNPIFNCYTSGSTTGTGIALYKLVGSGTDEPIFQATLEGANESGLLTVPASATSAVINVVSNVDWVIYSDDDVEFSEEEGNSSASVEVTFPANETEEPVTYTINIESDLGEYEFVITQEAFVPAGESVYRKVTSVTAGKKYILAAYVGGKLLAATPIAADKTYGYPVGTEVSSTDGVIDTRHADLELTFASVTGGYSIAQPDARYWAMTGTYNSINVYYSAQESYVWTVTAKDDGTVDVVNAGKGKHVVYNVNRSYFAVYETVNDSNIYPALYEYIDGGDTPVDPPVGEEVYSFTITKDDFNGTSYNANNGNHTSTATSNYGHTMEVTWKSNQVMAQSDGMQWQKNTAYIESVTDLVSVLSVDIASTAGEFTIKKEAGYFKVSVGNATGKTTGVTVTFKTSGDTPVVETVATPTFSPASGEVAAGTTVTISCTTSGATIHYTTDGSTPTASSTTGTSVTVNAAMTIKAIAVKDGMNDSSVAEANYTIKSTTVSYDWARVSALSDLSAGEYVITALNEGKYYAVPSTTIDGQTFTCIEGDFDESSQTFAPAEGSGEFVFTAGPVDNSFYIYNSTLEKYLVATGSKKFGYVDSTSSNYGYWTFTAVSSGGFSGVFSVQHSNKTHYMRAYSNTVRCYDGANNNGVYLFKN